MKLLPHLLLLALVLTTAFAYFGIFMKEVDGAETVTDSDQLALEEVYCKLCHLHFAPNRMSMGVECFDCVDLNSQKTDSHFSKIFII